MLVDARVRSHVHSPAVHDPIARERRWRQCLNSSEEDKEREWLGSFFFSLNLNASRIDRAICPQTALDLHESADHSRPVLDFDDRIGGPMDYSTAHRPVSN